MKFKTIQIGDITSLSNLRVGSIAEIQKINYKNLMVRRRLFEMGFTSGVEIEIKKTAPLGDPVVIKIRGYELCLRMKELKNVEVKVLK